MSFLTEGTSLSLDGVILHTLNLYPLPFKIKDTKQKTFVKCKEIAQNMEFIKCADNFPLDILLLSYFILNMFTFFKLLGKTLARFQKDDISHQTGTLMLNFFPQKSNQIEFSILSEDNH